eukprot:510774-Amphidinium_carterae.1
MNESPPKAGNYGLWHGQADELANQGTAVHGHLDLDVTWTKWDDFANKLYHFWRRLGPQVRERPE